MREESEQARWVVEVAAYLRGSIGHKKVVESVLEKCGGAKGEGEGDGDEGR